MVTLTAKNPYTNISFDIEVNFTRTHDDIEERILWIVVVVVGALMILGLLIAYARQKKRLRKYREEQEEKRGTLLT